jgi:sugar/nucleoside kinase (ribokinase family)
MRSLVDSAHAEGSAFVDVAKLLAVSGLRVGWAAVVEDDRRGRTLLAELAALDVEIGGAKLATVGTDLVVVDGSGAWSGLLSDRGKRAPVEIPVSWSSRVLLLSGLTPLTSSLAAFCKAARRARRDGTVVVLDLVGSLRDWNGQDSRLISMVLREADVVRCSLLDLAVIGTDTMAVRGAMKPNATLFLDDETGARALGTFGDVRVQVPRPSTAAEGLAEGYTAAICVEYARPHGVEETLAGRWHRVLRHEAPRVAAAATNARPASARRAQL